MMIANIRTERGSSTPKQRQLLHQLKRRWGWTDDQLHDAIGAVSTKVLSAADASRCIRRLGGGELPNPPGRKPAPYQGRRQKTDATRMIAPGHEEQIERLLREHFGDLESGLAWLEKNFDVQCTRDLLTAKRAGEVIYVLKEMIARTNK